MATEGATNISELDKAAPAGNAPAGEADDHLRMIKDVLLASFPALDGLISNSTGTGGAGDTNPPDAATWSALFTKNNAADAQKVPVGGIILWSGTDAQVPTGWAICDGLNGTPDLRNRFVLGSAEDSTLYVPGNSGGDTWEDVGGFPGLKSNQSPDAKETVNADTGTTSAQSNVQFHGHWYLPNFYALAYIQYVGT